MGLFIEWNSDYLAAYQARGRHVIPVLKPGLNVKVNLTERQQYCAKKGIPFDGIANQPYSQPPPYMPPEQDLRMPFYPNQDPMNPNQGPFYPSQGPYPPPSPNPNLPYPPPPTNPGAPPFVVSAQPQEQPRHYIIDNRRHSFSSVCSSD